MISKAVKILHKKHLLIIGKTEIDRSVFIDKIAEVANFEIFRFPSKMKSFEDYSSFVREKKLYEPWYEKKGNFNWDQILDFHWDWIANNNALVIMEEFDKMEIGWRNELLKVYLHEAENRKKGSSFMHLIISQENEKELIEDLMNIIDIKPNELRSNRQVIEQNLEVINISDREILDKL